MKFSKIFVAAASLFLLASCGNSKGGSSNDSVDPVTTYTVTFDYNYEGAPAALEVAVNKGEKVAKPEDPEEREGFKFMGWYKSKTSTDSAFAFDFDQAIYQDYKVYAGWGELSLQVWCVVGSFQGWNIDEAPEMTSEDGENYTYTFNCPAGTNFKIAKDHAWDVQAVYENVDLENSDVEALGISENEHDKDNHNIHIENAASVRVDYNPFEQVITVKKAGDLELVVTGYSLKWKGSMINNWGTDESLSPETAQLTGKWTTSEQTLIAGTAEFGFLLTTYYDDGSSLKDEWHSNWDYADTKLTKASNGNYAVNETGKYVFAVTVDDEGVFALSVESFEAVEITKVNYNFYLAGSVADWGVNDTYVFEPQDGAKLEGTWTCSADLAVDEQVQPIYTMTMSDESVTSVSWMGTGGTLCAGIVVDGGNYKAEVAGTYLFTITVDADANMTVVITK